MGFGNSVSLQADDAGHVDAAALAHVAYVVGWQTNDVRRNWKGLKTLLRKPLHCKQGYALKNWVEGLSDEAFYPWESPKKIWLQSVNPKFVTEQKKFLIHW